MVKTHRGGNTPTGPYTSKYGYSKLNPESKKKESRENLLTDWKKEAE